MAKISVIGAGAWGTTLTILCAEKGHLAHLWCFEKDLAAQINRYHENKTYLPGFKLPVSIEAVSELKEACSKTELIIFAVPTQHLRSIAQTCAKYLGKDQLVLSAAKGIEIKTFKRPTQILEEFISQPAALSGPNLSHEIAQGKPAASVAAHSDLNYAKKIQKLLSSDRFRIYTNPDVAGVELGGALKNIIAIAAGIVDTLQLGDNAKAGLLVRGINEMQVLGSELGANQTTFSGLSGMGDLITTCSSHLSRNHRVGEQLAQGQTLEEIQKCSKEVAEGIPTAKAVYTLAKKKKLDLPITQQVYQILYEGKHAYQAIADLMNRPLKSE